jgi:ribosomal protein S18 acetylase RimI-like enzyme
MELRKYYDPLDREWVAIWVDSEAVAEDFCGLSQVTDRMFEDWLSARDQLQFMLNSDNGESVAYGEIWLDSDGFEVEFAHLIVSNEARGEGFGATMLRLLTDHVKKKMKKVRRILVRNEQENVAAAGALQKALFTKLAPIPEDWSDEYDWYYIDLDR